RTNSVRVMIDGEDNIFGSVGARKFIADFGAEASRPTTKVFKSTLEYRYSKVTVTQHVQIMPGAERKFDTLLIYYILKNNDTDKHKVGLRLLLDPYIGDSDGVPFLAPGEGDYITKSKVYKNKDAVPPYLEAVETPASAKDPGTIARLTCKG